VRSQLKRFRLQPSASLQPDHLRFVGAEGLQRAEVGSFPSGCHQSISTLATRSSLREPRDQHLIAATRESERAGEVADDPFAQHRVTFATPYCRAAGPARGTPRRRLHDFRHREEVRGGQPASEGDDLR
jgi:hypothetical protein